MPHESKAGARARARDRRDRGTRRPRPPTPGAAVRARAELLVIISSAQRAACSACTDERALAWVRVPGRMVLLPALLLLAASGAHGNISNVPDPLVRQAACDCAGFCSGHCSLPTPAGAPETLTLYRLTPRNITDLVNKDTGDAEGDAFFTLDEYDLPMRCSQGASTNARGCFLDVNDIYMAFEVEVDGLYGPYGHCNPPHQNSLVGNFSCRGMGHGAAPQNTSAYCYCPRTNRTVGRQHVSDQFGRYGSGFVSKLSHLLDGYWYSTPEL